MKIERADVSFPGKADAADFSFVVDSEAVPPFDRPTITAVRPLTPYRKFYERAVGRDDIAATDGGHLVFVATDAGRLIGYIVLSRKWNGFASIDELAVDIPARRSGAGRQLMDAALAWARANALPGLFAETQSNNVAACRFYEKCGFVLGGFDRYLYAAIEANRHETALYWYLILPPDVERTVRTG